MKITGKLLNHWPESKSMYWRKRYYEYQHLNIFCWKKPCFFSPSRPSSPCFTRCSFAAPVTLRLSPWKKHDERYFKNGGGKQIFLCKVHDFSFFVSFRESFPLAPTTDLFIKAWNYSYLELLSLWKCVPNLK